MFKIFQTLFLLLLVTALFSQEKGYVTRKIDMQKLDYYEAALNSFQPLFSHPTLHNKFAPAGTVPFPINYSDYATNGNNMRRVFVLGDTVVVAQDINSDNSGPPPIVYGSRVQYNFSVDGGQTWQTDAINTGGTTANRWPNIFPIYNSGLRSLISTGRLYLTNTGTTGQGNILTETLLGLGSFSFNSLPTRFYRDYFGYIKNSTTVGGVIAAGTGVATDSLFYVEFNFVTNTFSTPVMIAPAMATNYRYYCAISTDGQNVFAAWHEQGPQVLHTYESTNGGTTWSSDYMVGPPNFADSSWLMADVVYKPNSTQRCMTYATVGTSDRYRSGSKILFWSPTINSGNPTVVADFTKYPFMLDSVGFFTAFDNATDVHYSFRPYSTPSLSWSDDGTVLYCAFNAVQPDTSTYATGTNYHFQDILISQSLDNGATWSPLRYVTHTARRDEIYPSLSKTGNTATTFNITYNESGSPGCFTFNQNAPADTTYSVFKRLVFANLQPVSVKNISTQVPESFSLSQNYPNPFNPTTTIKFTLPKSSVVTIKVYSITGQLVATLAENEATQVGTNEVKFNGENLSSGIYFYTIEAGSFKETKKMMLIK
jgi:hypothetical protein